MISFNLFILSTVKFGKCFAKFMIPMALSLGAWRLNIVTTIEITSKRRCSGKENIKVIYKRKRVTTYMYPRISVDHH